MRYILRLGVVCDPERVQYGEDDGGDYVEGVDLAPALRAAADEIGGRKIRPGVVFKACGHLGLAARYILEPDRVPARDPGVSS